MITNALATHSSSGASPLTFTSWLARISFLLGWTDFFESPFFRALMLVSFRSDFYLNFQLCKSPLWSSSLLSLPPLVMAGTPGCSSALQSASRNICLTPPRLTIITEHYGGANTYHPTMPSVVWGIQVYISRLHGVWSIICSEPELTGITITSRTKALSKIIPVHPASRSTLTPSTQLANPNVGLTPLLWAQQTALYTAPSLLVDSSVSLVKASSPSSLDTSLLLATLTHRY